MRTDKHNGRTPAEKAQRLLVDPEKREADRQREKAEEEHWASLAGPVTVRKKNDEPNRED